MLAAEFYRVMRQIQELERKIEDLPSGSPERDELMWQLRDLQAEKKRIKALLEGAKSG